MWVAIGSHNGDTAVLKGAESRDRTELSEGESDRRTGVLVWQSRVLRIHGESRIVASVYVGDKGLDEASVSLRARRRIVHKVCLKRVRNLSTSEVRVLSLNREGVGDRIVVDIHAVDCLVVVLRCHGERTALGWVKPWIFGAHSEICMRVQIHQVSAQVVELVLQGGCVEVDEAWVEAGVLDFDAYVRGGILASAREVTRLLDNLDAFLGRRRIVAVRVSWTQIVCRADSDLLLSAFWFRVVAIVNRIAERATIVRVDKPAALVAHRWGDKELRLECNFLSDGL